MQSSTKEYLWAGAYVLGAVIGTRALPVLPWYETRGERCEHSRVMETPQVKEFNKLVARGAQYPLTPEEKQTYNSLRVDSRISRMDSLAKHIKEVERYYENPLVILGAAAVGFASIFAVRAVVGCYESYRTARQIDKAQTK